MGVDGTSKGPVARCETSGCIDSEVDPQGPQAEVVTDCGLEQMQVPDVFKGFGEVADSGKGDAP